MAWTRQQQREYGTAYQLTWRTPDGRSNRRTFRSKDSLREFALANGLSLGEPSRRGPRPVDLAERIRRMSEEDPQTGCWVWRGRPTNRGYGQMTIRTETGPRTVSAHRVSYETFVGPIPDGLVIDHLCRQRMCVNPSHLEPVTQRENVMRSPIAPGAVNAAKTHCPKGHAYNRTNTVHYVHPNGTTRMRLCRTCQRSQWRSAWARRSQRAEAVSA